MGPGSGLKGTSTSIVRVVVASSLSLLLKTGMVMLIGAGKDEEEEGCRVIS